MPETEVVVVFPTTHLTLKAEGVLERAGVSHRTIMKPRKISSDCGLALRIGREDLEVAKRLFEEGSLVPTGFFSQVPTGWEPVPPGGSEG